MACIKENMYVTLLTAELAANDGSQKKKKKLKNMFYDMVYWRQKVHEREI